MKKLTTLQFGDIEIEDEHIIHFPEGILGFENLKNSWSIKNPIQQGKFI
jgi:flagellar assembly factor FliW